MKTPIQFLVAATILSVLVASCSSKKAVIESTELADDSSEQLYTLENATDSMNYALGYSLASMLKEQGVALEEQVIKAAMEETTADRSQLSTAEVQQLIRQVQTYKQVQAGKIAKAEGEAYLAKNKMKEGVMTTNSGLQYEILKAGEGPTPKASDEVTVHYTGTMLDGTKFDSSLDRGAPSTFRLNRVIKGWTEGLQLMNKGAQYKFTIPGDIAYGERGNPNADIAPNAVLIFTVELIDFNE